MQITNTMERTSKQALNIIMAVHVPYFRH